jgi:cyclopropane fatty-acyl-phospholipid synthase-like methyltransferase
LSTPSDYYERYWTDEGYNPRRLQTPPELERLYRQHIRPGDDCLDLGCGDGGASGLYLAEHARSYIGADVSETAVARAKMRGLDAICRPGRARPPVPR